MSAQGCLPSIEGGVTHWCSVLWWLLRLHKKCREIKIDKTEWLKGQTPPTHLVIRKLSLTWIQAHTQKIHICTTLENWIHLHSLSFSLYFLLFPTQTIRSGCKASTFRPSVTARTNVLPQKIPHLEIHFSAAPQTAIYNLFHRSSHIHTQAYICMHCT